MKKASIVTLIGLTLLVQAYGQTNSEIQTNDKTEKTYSNEIYRFSAIVPSSWRLHGQIVNDTRYHMAIAGWGLPKIYSELEKTEIENSVSIVAYQREDIDSVEKLIQFEYIKYKRTNPSAEIILEEDKTCLNARTINITESSGKKYQGKWYIYFQNDIGYIIAFMATPGTYEKNLKAFEEFHKNVKLY